MTNINGQVAEGMIKNVFKDLGLLEKCPVTTEEMMIAIENNPNPHFDKAYSSLDYDYGFIEVNNSLFADRCLGCDGFILDPNSDIIYSYDITVNPKTYSMNNKYYVQSQVRQVRKKLGLNNHIIIFLQSNINYLQLTQEHKYQIEDEVLEAISNNEKEVYITL